MKSPYMAAQGVASLVATFRHDLHQIPEVRWEEEGTLNYILAMVKKSLMLIDPNVNRAIIFTMLKGGLVVDITIDPGKPLRLFRADVDALPIVEQTGHPFASTNGKMHACGHDMHSAMLLGAFLAICNGNIVPSTNLRFVWQRAEENPLTESGGACLVRERVCEGVESVHGLHVDPNYPMGTFLSRPGPMLANSDRLQVKITCSGGHVAMPHSGSNAIDIGVRICQALEGFALRTLGPNEPISLVPAQFNAGTASNVRPGSAELWFAVRTFLNPERRAQFHAQLKAQVEGIVNLYPNARCEVTPINGHPALSNNAASYEQVAAVLRKGCEVTQVAEPILGGEDFAHYLNKVPGSFWMLGAHQEGSGDFHTATFNPSEDALVHGVHYWLLLATM